MKITQFRACIPSPKVSHVGEQGCLGYAVHIWEPRSSNFSSERRSVITDLWMAMLPTHRHLLNEKCSKSDIRISRFVFVAHFKHVLHMKK